MTDTVTGERIPITREGHFYTMMAWVITDPKREFSEAIVGSELIYRSNAIRPKDMSAIEVEEAGTSSGSNGEGQQYEGEEGYNGRNGRMIQGRSGSWGATSS